MGGRKLYDLHTHTTASDGTLTPCELADAAVKSGLAGIAITDHDTVAGLDIALEYKKQTNLPIEIIPGIEMNTEYGDEEVHILGYFINYHDSSLINRLSEIKKARYTRARNMVTRLQKMGLSIDFAQVERLAHGDLIARPHIARALMEKGYVFSLKEAFNKYIDRGKPGYVPRYKFLPEEAIALIQKAGGISVLAHPGLIKDQDGITRFINMGIDGLEVFYPEHSNRQINYYLLLCARNNLLITGGSDFHGLEKDKNKGKLGLAGLNYNDMQNIYKHMRRKK